MNRHLGTGRAVALTLISALIVVLAPVAPPALAATPITVTQAIGQQNGSSQTVRGYVVGQPTATNTVVKSGFPNDYALAIADSATQASTSQMLYVQIPSAFRSQWGLRTNPSAPAIGKTGTALRSSLHGIIDGHTTLSYAQVWTALQDTDQDPNNTANVIEL